MPIPFYTTSLPTQTEHACLNEIIDCVDRFFADQSLVEFHNTLRNDGAIQCVLDNLEYIKNTETDCASPTIDGKFFPLVARITVPGNGRKIWHSPRRMSYRPSISIVENLMAYAYHRYMLPDMMADIHAGEILLPMNTMLFMDSFELKACHYAKRFATEAILPQHLITKHLKGSLSNQEVEEYDTSSPWDHSNPTDFQKKWTDLCITVAECNQIKNKSIQMLNLNIISSALNELRRSLRAKTH